MCGYWLVFCGVELKLIQEFFLLSMLLRKHAACSVISDNIVEWFAQIRPKAPCPKKLFRARFAKDPRKRKLT